MRKSVPNEAIKAWHKALLPMQLEDSVLDSYTNAYADFYDDTQERYPNATTELLIEYTIASVAQIMRHTVIAQHRTKFDALWKEYAIKFPILRTRLEQTKRGYEA